MVTSGTVRVSCPGCGEIDVLVDDVTIRTCVELAQNTYRFHCDHCDMFVIKDASQTTLLLLLRAGVRVDTWHIPADIRERRDGLSIPH